MHWRGTAYSHMWQCVWNGGVYASRCPCLFGRHAHPPYFWLACPAHCYQGQPLRFTGVVWAVPCIALPYRRGLILWQARFLFFVAACLHTSILGMIGRSLVDPPFVCVLHHRLHTTVHIGAAPRPNTDFLNVYTYPTYLRQRVAFSFLQPHTGNKN